MKHVDILQLTIHLWKVYFNFLLNKKDIVFFNKKLKYTFHKCTPTTQFVQRVLGRNCSMAQLLTLIWTSDVELELFCVGGMSRNREVLCGGIIEDSWDGCSPRTELVIMSPITCFSFDETRWYTATTDEADLCPVTVYFYQIKCCF
jgi:hypothetical protein